MNRTNFKMEYENITMTRGDTVSFNCECFDQNYQSVNVDNAWLTVRERITGEPVFTKTIGSGISQDVGMLTIRIAPEDTQEIDEGIYFYDFVINVNNDVFTLKKGTLTVEWDSTY